MICEHLVSSHLHPNINDHDKAMEIVQEQIVTGNIDPIWQPPEKPREVSSAAKARANKRKAESDAAEAAPLETLQKVSTLARSGTVGPAVLNFVQPPSPANLVSILENAANAAFKAKAIADGASKAFDEVGMQLVAAKADLMAHMQAGSSSGSK